MGIFARTLLKIVIVVGISAAGGAEAALDPERWTIGGEIRERYEFRNNADFDHKIDDTLSFVGSRIRLQLGYEATPDIGVFIQIQDSRLFGSETSTGSNEKNLDLHQGYLVVRNLAGPLTLTLGRQEMIFGDSRLVGNFDWSNVGRSFDGLRFAYILDLIRVDLWAVITKEFGSNIGPDPAVSVSNHKSQQFYGIYTAMKIVPFFLEPYVMYLRDTGNAGEVDPVSGNLVSPITAPAARGQDRVTIGLRLGGKLMDDAIDFTGEGAYQLGTMDARGTVPESEIRAYAVAVKAGYTLPVILRPRVGIEYDRASGDDNPADNKFKTFENLFPTNHIYYGYMDYVGWRNMQDLRFSLGVKPMDGSGVSLDYHFFWLADKNDNWYAASGQIFRSTPTGNTEMELGQEVDVVAYTVVKEKIRLEAGYGHFFPGDYVKVNFPTATDASDFAYLQLKTNF